MDDEHREAHVREREHADDAGLRDIFDGRVPSEQDGMSENPEALGDRWDGTPPAADAKDLETDDEEDDEVHLADLP